MGNPFNGIICNSLFCNSLRIPIKGMIEYPKPAKIACFTASFDVSSMRLFIFKSCCTIKRSIVWRVPEPVSLNNKGRFSNIVSIFVLLLNFSSLLPTKYNLFCIKSIFSTFIFSGRMETKAKSTSFCCKLFTTLFLLVTSISNSIPGCIFKKSAKKKGITYLPVETTENLIFPNNWPL